MKVLAAALLGSVLVFAVHSHNLERMREVTVLLDGEVGMGSGVVIAPGVVLTAAHVADNFDGTPFSVTTDAGRTYWAGNRVVYSDPEQDFAVVSAPNVDCPCAMLAGAEQWRDGALWAVGYPMYPIYQAQTITTGALQGHNRDGKLAMTVPIVMGNSGGPVFSRGYRGFELVGIVSSVTAAPPMIMGGPGGLLPHLSYAVPLAAIQEGLEALRAP